MPELIRIFRSRPNEDYPASLPCRPGKAATKRFKLEQITEILKLRGLRLPDERILRNFGIAPAMFCRQKKAYLALIRRSRIQAIAGRVM